MRVISNFKEPYDSLLKNSYDEILYVRKEKSSEIKYQFYNAPYIVLADAYNVMYYRIFIINNKIIPLIHIKERYLEGGLTTLQYGNDFVFYDIDDLFEYQRLFKNKLSYYHNEFKNFFDQSKNEIIIESPVAEVDLTPACKQGMIDCTLMLNVKLPDFFYSHMPPYQVFQEIESWFLHLVLPQKEIIEVEDKYKIQQHGFDKMSFRNRGQ